MAHQLATPLLNWIGFVTWGDIGPLTIYRRYDGRLVSFAKTWPAKPATEKQAAQRALFLAACQAWRALTPAARAQWCTAGRRSHAPVTGFNIFVHHQLIGDDGPILTLQRQTRTSLLP